MFKYFDFIPTGTFTGTYLDGTNGTNFIINGSYGHANDLLHFGTDWNESLTYSSINPNVSVENLTVSDWTSNQKNEWLSAYLTHVNLESFITNTTVFNAILQYAENNNIFYKLSFPSLAYITQNSTSGEVSIGCNVYKLQLVYDYGETLSNNDNIKIYINTNHKKETIYASALMKVSYLGETNIVWCFGGIEYNYDLSNLSNTPSFLNGGGNMIGQVKLGGNGIKAHYFAKRNIDPQDPTQGFCSGEDGPFCIGDEIHLIDDTIWSKTDGTSWSWIGDYSNLPYTWYIADITNPCIDYHNYSVNDMKFPIRVIQSCTLDDFGINIVSFNTLITPITDIIVQIDELTNWTVNQLITISESSNTYFEDQWKIVAKSNNHEVLSHENDGYYYRLRKIGMDNSTLDFSTGTYKIYLTF